MVDIEEFKVAINYDRYYAKHGEIVKITSRPNLLNEKDFFRTIVFEDGFYLTFFRGMPPHGHNSWMRGHSPNNFKYHGWLKKLSQGQLNQLKKNGIID